MRDRFTRTTIMSEFKDAPGRNCVQLDAAKHWYATPVANNRYTVVWHKVGNNVAQVKAVVASQLKGESAADLKSKLEKVVAYETNGVLTTLF
jgi:hypothetical protein